MPIKKFNKKKMPMPKRAPPPQNQNQNKNRGTFTESFKSGLGFGTGIEAVRAISDTLSNNVKVPEFKTEERCSLEKRKLFACLDENFNDLSICSEYLQAYKNNQYNFANL